MESHLKARERLGECTFVKAATNVQDKEIRHSFLETLKLLNVFYGSDQNERLRHLGAEALKSSLAALHVPHSQGSLAVVSSRFAQHSFLGNTCGGELTVQTCGSLQAKHRIYGTEARDNPAWASRVSTNCCLDAFSQERLSIHPKHSM